ncbi:MAG: hypothetical protein O3B06_04855 [Actinobacteria bacterium]|nr:hypothetical protein [Actinomycetota bacterium]
MGSGLATRRGLSILLVSLGVCAISIAAPTRASVSADPARGPWVEWGGDLVAHPLRLSLRPVVIEVIVDSWQSASSEEQAPRLVIEQLSPWRRTVFDAPMSVRHDDVGTILRTEWSMFDVRGRARPGEYLFTLETDPRRGFTPSTTSLRVDVWPSAVKRIPATLPPADSSRPEVVIIGRQQLVPET